MTRSTRRTIAFLALAGLLLGALAGLAVHLLRPGKYHSTSQVYVSMGPGNDSQSNQPAQDRIATYANLATSDAVLVPVAQKIGMSVDAVRGDVTVQTNPGTVLLSVDTAASEASQAKELNESVTDQLQALFNALENPGGEGAASMTVVNPASAGTLSGWGPARHMLAGAIAGLLLGLAAAWLRLRVARTVRRSSELATVVDADVVTIPDDAPPLSAARLVASALDDHQSVLVTHRAGSSSLARDLADALSASGERTAYVDLRFDGSSEGRGVADVVEGRAQLADVIRDERGVAVVDSGTGLDAASVVGSAACRTLLEKLREASDRVVIDASDLSDPGAVVGAVTKRTAAVAVIDLGGTSADDLVELLTPIDRAAGSLVTVARDPSVKRHRR